MSTALAEQAKLRHEQLGKYLTDRAIISAEQWARALSEQKTRPNVRLGEILVEANLITSKQLQEALKIQATHRQRRLGDILIEMGAVTVRVIQIALSDKLGIPYVNVREFKLDPTALEFVDSWVASRYPVLPLLRSGESLIVEVENPLAIDFSQDLRLKTSLTIVPVIADTEELKIRIAKEYAWRPSRGEFDSDTGSYSASDLRDDDRDTDSRVSENTLVRLVNKIIIEAHAQGASDIPIESNPGRANSPIKFNAQHKENHEQNSGTFT
jgi:hypothetical protein